MARPQKRRCICSKPKITSFSPQDCTANGNVNLTYDEYEVVRILDFLKMTQEECAVKMDISRPTVTRIYDTARQKIADAMVNGRSLTIHGGDVVVCEKVRPECADMVHCCHRQQAEETNNQQNKAPVEKEQER